MKKPDEHGQAGKELPETAEKLYTAGANLALYHVARAFCVKSDDIRLAEMPIRDKAKLLVQRIQEEMGGNDGKTD